MSAPIPELLVREDFNSPILYKIYTYLRIIYRIGIAKTPIREYFTKNELMTIIDTLQNCPSDTEFTEKFKKGICENVSMRDSANLQNRTERTFNSSFIRKKTNPIIKSLYPNTPIDGEIDVLDCLFYKYASKVFEPLNDGELGFDGDGIRASFKKKELQLEAINKLFCNMGNRINKSRNDLINKSLETVHRKDSMGNKIYEDLPKELITSYLGGKKRLTRHKNKQVHKRKKTIRKYKKSFKKRI